MKRAALGLALLLAGCATQPKLEISPPAVPAVHPHKPHVTPKPKRTPHKVATRVPLPRPRPPAAETAIAAKFATLPKPKPAPAVVTPARPAPKPFVPAGAVTYAPLLASKQREIWPSAPRPWSLAGLVEQESCASLKSARCWNPHAELKTAREYGFGFGQITTAYNADGSERFNEFNELKRQHASLRSWAWSDRYDAGYQLVAVVEMTSGLWRRMPPASDDDSHWAFTLAAYNGGLGSLLQDRRLCGNSAGCDVTRWFGNIETHSVKSRSPQKAYGGQSWFSINRGYVRNVLLTRRAKYRQFWE